MRKLLLSIFIILVLVGYSYAGFIGGGERNPETTIDKVDEFLGGNNTSGSIGDLGWSTSVTGTGGSITVTQTAPVANHNGIRNVAVSTVAATAIGSINLFNGSTSIIPTDYFDVTYIFKIPTVITNQEFRVGLTSVGSSSAPPAAGAYFVYDTVGTSEGGTDNTHWVCSTRQGGTSTLTATSTTVATATWYKMRIRRISSTQIEFLLNDVSVCTHNTNTPTTNLMPNMQLENLETTALTKDFDVDYARIRITGQSR